MRSSIFFAFFPYGNTDRPSVRQWYAKTIRTIHRDPAISAMIGEVFDKDYDDTPIPMTRNRALIEARTVGADFCVMIDNDMQPDAVAGAPPFFDTALKFMIRRERPCVVGAPYCGPPPHENPYIFLWRNQQSHHPNADLKLEMFTREEAHARGGIEQVAALPTGLIMFDMRFMDKARHPIFDYEWQDDGPPCPTCKCRVPGPRAWKASTEDVYTTRNLSLVGVEQYVLWDCWANHWKWKAVHKPTPITIDQVVATYRGAIVANHDSREKLVFVGAGAGPTITPPPPWLATDDDPYSTATAVASVEAQKLCAELGNGEG